MNTYGRTYCFQQQDGCQSRGSFYFRVPDDADDFENETVPEEVNHSEMGVSFSAWLKRDPKEPFSDKLYRGLWWKRNFYPEFQMVANDLHAKGFLPEGSYRINIDW